MSSMVSLHALALDDLPTIASLHATSWRRAYRGILGDDYLDGDLVAERTAVWREKLADGVGLGWIVRVDGAPAGFVFVRPHADAQWGTLVDNLHVLPTYQGHGLGKRLLHEVATWCMQYAPDAGVYLWVFTDNTPARGFYARVGGAEVEAVEQLASDGRVLPELRVAWASPQALMDGAAARV
ncbi:MAG: GNAT family N-acetyltransferase [Gemmatimonadaceae bacterium]|nr:GNAT family N-acetyltransferase [Gemmatimonadaceae bacterium]